EQAGVETEALARDHVEPVEAGAAGEELAAGAGPEPWPHLEAGADREAVLRETQLAVVEARVVPVGRSREPGRERQHERREIGVEIGVEESRMRERELLVADADEPGGIPEEGGGVVGDGAERSAHTNRARSHRHLIARRGGSCAREDERDEEE